MPAPTTTDELLGLIRRSNLIEQARLDAYLTTHTDAAGGTPADLARQLAAAGLLTGFHTEQLLKGKHRGFFLGKYKLLERIGMGGMGQVFLAEHTSMKRRAAVKVLPPDMAANEYARERFLREARAAGQLDHPNLVRAFDVDADGDVVYLVMEYLEGISLHDLVTKFGPLDPARAAHYLWQVANGLSYVHASGLVHRDIKPANLLVDRVGVVKILDLGLVRSLAEDNELTRGQGVKMLGTADYLAPEQAIDCSAVDIRADIYSLGATAYFLLTGGAPFPSDKVAQKLIAHQTRPVPRAAVARPDVPVELSDIVARMMAKKPDDRFASPAEVAVALEPWAHAVLVPPSDRELPVGAGGPASTVSLGGNPARTAGRTQPSGAGSGGLTGSGVRYYHPDSGAYRPGGSGRLSGSAASTAAASAAPTPPPSPPRVPGRSGLGVIPPLLPAAHTHGPTPNPAAGPDSAVVNPFKSPLPGAVPTLATEPPGPTRRRFGLVAALLIAAAVGAWNAVVMSGAGSTPAPANVPALPAAGAPNKAPKGPPGPGSAVQVAADRRGTN